MGNLHRTQTHEKSAWETKNENNLHRYLTQNQGSEQKDVISNACELKLPSGFCDPSLIINLLSDQQPSWEPSLDHIRNRSLLVSGYIRRKCKQHMTHDIVSLCTSFCDALILYWDIYKDTNSYINSWDASDQQITGPLFKINDVTLQMSANKGGTSTHPLGYEFFINAISIPDHIDSISFYAICNMSGSHSISRYYRQNICHVFRTSIDSTTKQVKIYQTKPKDHRTKASEHCKLIICAEILDVEYTDKQKETITHVQIDKTVSHKWKIPHSLLDSIKNGTAHALSISPRFGIHFNWRLIFWHDDRHGNTKLMLQLLRLPNHVSSIDTRVQLGYNNKQRKSRSYLQKRFGYQQEKKKKFRKLKAYKPHYKVQEYSAQECTAELVWNKETLLSSELYGLQSLYFTVDIMIMKAYHVQNIKECLIPTHQWVLFGIVQKGNKTKKTRKKHEHHEKSKEVDKVKMNGGEHAAKSVEACQNKQTDERRLENIEKEIKVMKQQQNENTNTLKVMMDMLQHIQNTVGDIYQRLDVLDTVQPQNDSNDEMDSD